MQGKTNRRRFLKHLSFASLPFLLSNHSQAMRSDSPNVVLILADDLGYGSIGCYGADASVVQTPAIDALAEEGVRFTDACTPSSVCSPTRYGLLMGRYPWRTPMKHGVVNVNDPLLPDPDRTSLARWLKKKNYSTAAIGKWHLGYGSASQKKPQDWTKVLRPGPLELGFDYHFAVPQNHGDVTGVYIENDRIYGLESDRVYPYSKSFYGSPYYGFDAPQRVNKQVMEDLTDRAVNWMKEQKDKPFFLYFTPVAVHHPITPSDAMRGESGCGPYGDFIQDLDHSIGRICQTLSDMGIEDNTIVIVTSDNGGDIPTQRDRPECIAQELGLNINGSLRGDKHTIWEGGARVPFLVRWPEKISGGKSSSAMINLLDVFSTVAELIDDKPLENEEIAPDSVSFRQSLMHPENRSGSERKEMITTNAQGIFAIRKGSWKYVEGRLPDSWTKNRNSDYQGQAVRQLFDLVNDPAETTNLIDDRPETADEMQSLLDRIRLEDK